MRTQLPNLILSGIEPVDKLLGGLDSDELYLLHGEASGKSLFGIKFLIEGLKEGENCAMVIRYSPEDAVQRFARLGYDCLEDVYSGRLVMLECSDDIIQRIGGLRELTPVLRELEWLLGETRPSRLIFDPVTSILAGPGGNVETRAREFSEWARSFGATVILIANGQNPEIVNALQPVVAESFRFDVRETGDRAGRYIAFEKSSDIPDQLIEVDPSRGIFLLQPADVPRPTDVQLPAEIQSIREELRSTLERIRKDELEPLGEIDLSQPEPPTVTSEQPRETRRTTRLTASEQKAIEASVRVPAQAPPPTLELELEEPVLSTGVPPASLPIELTSEQAGEKPVLQGVDDLSHLLDDLSGSASPLDLDLPELEAPPRAKRERASDRLIDSSMAERVAEMLLAPPEATAELPPPVARSRKARQPQTSEKPQVRTKDFNVLVVLDDAGTCELVSKQLADYSVEIVHDGVSALAKLISFEPDLVVLDFDLPVVDGFKLLSLIRTSLDVPIIVVTGSRLRAIDRVMASELGADHYLTKPLSAKELKYKARQLIARYRGIDSWIVSADTPSQSQPASPVRREEFVPYTEFAREVEKRVKTAVDDVATFSVVGCSFPGMISDGGELALRLFETARGLLRETDLISTNPRNELVILLSDASASGARAFAARLRERITRELDQAPSLWTRTFPHLEESNECGSYFGAAFNDQLGRRITDRAPEAQITI